MRMKNCIRQWTNLCITWIDFKQRLTAWSFVFGLWTLLELMKTLNNILTIIIVHCKINLMMIMKLVRSVVVRRYLRERLFLLAIFLSQLYPSYWLQNSQHGLKTRNTYFHLCLIDYLCLIYYLKIFAKFKKEIISIINIIKLCCNDMNTEFCMSKCATLVTKKKVSSFVWNRLSERTDVRTSLQ